jgi:hypothetical protein
MGPFVKTILEDEVVTKTRDIKKKHEQSTDGAQRFLAWRPKREF